MLVKDSWLVSGKAETWIQAVRYQNLCSLSIYYVLGTAFNPPNIVQTWSKILRAPSPPIHQGNEAQIFNQKFKASIVWPQLLFPTSLIMPLKQILWHRKKPAQVSKCTCFSSLTPYFLLPSIFAIIQHIPQGSYLFLTLPWRFPLVFIAPKISLWENLPNLPCIIKMWLITQV